MIRLTPLCWLMLSFALGVTLNLNSQRVNLLILTLISFASLFFIKGKGRLTIAALLAFTLFGWLRASAFFPLKDFQEKELIIEGKVEKKNQKVSLQANKIIFKGKKFTVENKVFLSEVSLESGEKVTLKGKLTKIGENRFLLKNPILIKRFFPWYLKILEGTKKETVYFFKRNFPPPEANLLSSSLLGSVETDTALSELFRKAGVSHLLAVSGLHVGFVFIFLFTFFSFLSRLPRYLICFLFLLFYAGLAGFEPSVLRASLMLIIGFISLESGRNQNLLNNLSLTCLVILLLRPFFILDTGFQLSALAVAGIALFKPYLDQIIDIYPEGLKSLFTITLSAQMATLPLIFSKFGSFPPVSLFSNLLIIPVYSFLLPLNLINAALSFVSPFLCLPLLPLVFFLARLTLFLTKVFAFFPSLNSSLAPLFYLIVLVFLFSAFLISKNLKINLFSLFCSFLFLLSFALWHYSITSHFRAPTITFLDVGQGDACLVQLPRNQNLLIDGGQSSFLLLKNLAYFTVSKIDAVILSHPHQDHIGSFFDLPKTVKIYSLYCQTYPNQKEFKKLLSQYQQVGVKIHLIKNDSFYKATNGNLEFLPSYLKGNLNDSSLTLIFNVGDFSFLFPGDAEKKSQAYLAKKIKSVSVLKLPHHGSLLLASFLNKANPKIGIISVGKNNRYGHPRKEVISLLKKYKVKIFRTDENGWIRMEKKGKCLTISTQFPRIK